MPLQELTTFLLAISPVVLYGCGVLIAATLAATIGLIWQTRKVKHHLTAFAKSFQPVGGDAGSTQRDGLSLAAIDKIRDRCGKLDRMPSEWWKSLDSHIELYASPQDIEGWFLTEMPRELLSYELVIGKRFHTAMFSSFPGLLTGAGLTLTFVAILLALHGVHYDKANAADPVSGIDILINGLSGKFLSSIVALLLSIFFTLYEKRAVRSLRTSYEQMVEAISEAIPYLTQTRVLLDIQRFAKSQTVSVSHISSEVVDRLVGAFNSQIVPALADGMSSGVAEKMQSEFRPTMQQMNGTLEDLKTAIVGLETQKQESLSGEIRTLMTSLETSLVRTLSKMGDDFHSALTGAASQEFGNVKETLEATRHMLSEMNTQFGAMQTGFSTIIEKAEQSTSDQMKTGREQTEAVIAVMNGLMVRMQESADQNLNSVRTQLTLVVADLADKVGTLSKDMMSAAESVAAQAQASASKVLEQSGEWSEATAKRLDWILSSVEKRSVEFKSASESLLRQRDFLTDLISQNATALEQMAKASGSVNAYSSRLMEHSDAMRGVSDTQKEVAANLNAVSGNLRESTAQNEKIILEYRRTLDEYKGAVTELDQSLARILDALRSGLRDYHQSMENNFTEVVRIANPMIADASSFLTDHIEQLKDQLEELGSVISNSIERVNGRAK